MPDVVALQRLFLLLLLPLKSRRSTKLPVGCVVGDHGSRNESEKKLPNMQRSCFVRKQSIALFVSGLIEK